jgi:hypothetical protein
MKGHFIATENNGFLENGTRFRSTDKSFPTCNSVPVYSIVQAVLALKYCYVHGESS